MSNVRCHSIPDTITARQSRDELRLAHEAASAELIARRAKLRAAEAKRSSDPHGYQAALDATRTQRERVVTLVEQIRIAEARLTLAEAATPSSRNDRLSTSQRRLTTDLRTGGAR